MPVQRPAEIVNSGSVGNAPVLLAAALALGAMVSLGLALATSVRRHRYDLAILKTLGFTKHQVAATVFWHATTTVAVGFAIGAPLGAAAGRGLWNLFAGQLDVVAEPRVPLLVLLGIGVAALTIGNMVSAAPARAARRINPATFLHSE